MSVSSEPKPKKAVPVARKAEPRARRERNPEETRRRIIEAAETEFARKGFEGARLRDVAKAAGIHHALVHHYFVDKKGLFGAVVENAVRRPSAEALLLLRETTDPRALLERYVEMVIGLHVRHPNLLRLLHIASLDDRSPAFEACDAIRATIVQPLMEAIAKTIELAQAQGILRRDLDAKRLVTLALGTATYVFAEDGFFSAFLGEDVRSEGQVARHKEATMIFLEAAIFDPERVAAPKRTE